MSDMRACANVCREDLLEDLLRERDDVVAQRDACREAISVLRAAEQALEELPNTLHAMGGPLGGQPTRCVCACVRVRMRVCACVHACARMCVLHGLPDSQAMVVVHVG